MIFFFFGPIINSTAVLDESKRVNHMHCCTRNGLLQRRGISQTNHCQGHVELCKNS